MGLLTVGFTGLVCKTGAIWPTRFKSEQPHHQGIPEPSRGVTPREETSAGMGSEPGSGLGLRWKRSGTPNWGLRFESVATRHDLFRIGCPSRVQRFRVDRSLWNVNQPGAGLVSKASGIRQGLWIRATAFRHLWRVNLVDGTRPCLLSMRILARGLRFESVALLCSLVRVQAAVVRKEAGSRRASSEKPSRNDVQQEQRTCEDTELCQNRLLAPP